MKRKKACGIAAAVALAASPLLLTHTAHATTDTAAGSAIWSGYVGEEDAPYEGALGSWKVPAVQPTTAQFLGSATWVGVDGWNGDGYLIQAGTVQDTGVMYGPQYSAVWEVFYGNINGVPQTSGMQTLHEPVAPGDMILADVHKVLTQQNWWQIDISDATAGWTWSSQISYTGPGDSAEWIEEAYGGTGYTANWGDVHFSNVYVYSPIYDGSWVNPDLVNSDAVNLMTQSLNVIATPGPLSISVNDGLSFDDVFGSPTPAPTTTTTTDPPPAPTTTTTAPAPTTTSPPTTIPPRHHHRPKPRRRGKK